MTSNIRQINNYEWDERFYEKELNDNTLIYQPSVTYLMSCAYPQGYGLSQWRGDVGNKRADEILEETSEDGSFVHSSIEGILRGDKISGEVINHHFSPKRSLKIKRCLNSFLRWMDDFKPEIISTEFITWNDEYGFAGTVDLKCKIKDENYIVDFKTGKSIHEAHKVQICGYGLNEKTRKVALLHLGNTTKKKYSFNVLKSKDRVKFTNHFLQAVKMFKVLHPDAKPNSETFPEFFQLKEAKDDMGSNEQG